MYAEERRQAMATWINDQGRAAVTALADSFDVTPETVRRDLDRLEERGLVHRVHGGAVPAGSLQLLEQRVDQREHVHAREKQQIATKAREFLPDAGSAIVIDAGTTTGLLAAELPTDCELHVVTNAVPIAATLAAHPTASLRMLGGRVRGMTQAAVGDEAIDTLTRMRVQVAFMGTNGLSAAGATTPNGDEAGIKRAMVRAARQVVVLADASKLHSDHLHLFASADEIDVLVTDPGADPTITATLADAGIEVVLA